MLFYVEKSGSSSAKVTCEPAQKRYETYLIKMMDFAFKMMNFEFKKSLK